MQNVLLIIHLILAVCLIGAVLLQRSEGGGLGMGGGSGVMTSRGAASAMAKVTWGFAAAFIATSLVLTVLAAENSATGSVVDRLATAPTSATNTDKEDSNPLGSGSLLPPPSSSADAPQTPPPAE